MLEEREAWIVSYGRSPIGKAKKGTFANVNPINYAAQTLKGVLAKTPELDPAEIDDVIVGCAVNTGVQMGNIARNITIRAELPDSVPGVTVNRYCSSGLQAIAMAANAIIADQMDVVVAGGVDSMSLGKTETDMSTLEPWILENRQEAYWPMGITAEHVADLYNVTREDMDQMALESHQKAAKARDAGEFKREIIPIVLQDENGEDFIFEVDEGIRDNTSMEALAALKPSFQENGRVTAGNSSQTSDAAAFVVLMAREKAESLGIKPIAKFIGFAVGGVAPGVMGTGPMVAVPKLMNRIGMSVDQMDVIELNEAFAAQAVPCIAELGFDPEKVNPRGGALALGHPLGATGAILTSKALSYLEDTGGRYALITMCIGGGMGAAGVLEKL